jgi:hypothetical protein
MPEHDFAVLMLKVLVEVDARGGPAQHRGKRRLAGLDRLTPQILAIELEEVEGEQEYAVGRRTACRPVAGDRLAVDQESPYPQSTSGL